MKKRLMSCNFQKRNFVSEQKRKGSEDRVMEQDDGSGFRIGGIAEEEDVSVWTQAADNGGADGRIDGEALGSDRHLAIISDADLGLKTPNIRPPGAGRVGAKHGAIFCQGLSPGGCWSQTQFTMEFIGVDMRQELIQQQVGGLQFSDIIGSQ